MLEWLEEEEEALKIDNTVGAIFSEGKVKTPDLVGGSNTSDVGDAIADNVGMSPTHYVIIALQRACLLSHAELRALKYLPLSQMRIKCASAIKGLGESTPIFSVFCPVHFLIYRIPLIIPHFL